MIALGNHVCTHYARVAQLVEHDLAKVGAAGSSPVSRLKKGSWKNEIIIFSSSLLFSYSLSALFFFLLMYIRESAN